MNIEAVLKTFLMLGADYPAYRALFLQVLSLFDESDQDKLKAQYEEAIKQADAAHKAAQRLKLPNIAGVNDIFEN